MKSLRWYSHVSLPRLQLVPESLTGLLGSSM